MADFSYFQGRPVLVTGGAGFIGSHLVRGLLQAGAKVRVLDNFSNGSRANLAEVAGAIDVREGDITDLSACLDATRDVTIVFHLAALGSVPRSVEQPLLYNQVNIGGTLNVLEAARKNGAKRFVYSASSSAYGDTPVLAKVETMAPNPKSPYAITKLTGEYYVRTYANVYGLSGISLRYFNVFGPRQNPKSQYAAVIPAWITALLQGQRPKVYGDGTQSRDFCFVDNVVYANMLGGSSVKPLDGPVVNVACGQSITLNTMFTKIRETLGSKLDAEYLPPRTGDVKDSLGDIAAAQRVLGYTPRVYFDEGLQKTIAWYAQAGTNPPK
jgi:nucleoside-diphosphate-sugar epimerase